MDTVKLNGDGSTPIQPVLEKIKAVKTPKEMVTLVAEMTRQGFGPYFWYLYRSGRYEQQHESGADLSGRSGAG